jgi:two-component system, OmpR family, response regulator
MRILLVDDDVVFAKVIGIFLRSRGFVVEHAANLASARAMLPVAGWGAVLLDWQLPDGEGLSLLPDIRKHPDQPAVIVQSSRDQIEDRIQGLDAGADDYLAKPFSPDELLARLRAIERRRSGVLSAVINLGGLRIDLAQHTVSVRGVPVALTPLEWSLLRVLAARPDRVYSRERLALAIYEFNDEIDDDALEVLIHSLRSKLGMDSIQSSVEGYQLSGNVSTV